MYKILFMLNQFLGSDWTNRQINGLIGVFICFSRNHTPYSQHTKNIGISFIFMNECIRESIQCASSWKIQIHFKLSSNKKPKRKKDTKILCFVVVCCGEMNDDGQRFYKLQTEKRFKRTKWKCRMEMNMKMKHTITGLRD